MHWLCKIHDHPIQYKYTDSGKGATHTPEFLQLNPVGKIPVLKDGEFVLSERCVACNGRRVLFTCGMGYKPPVLCLVDSHAIMIYLSDKHGWEKWCPKDLKTRARVRSVLCLCEWVFGSAPLILYE